MSASHRWTLCWPNLRLRPTRVSSGFLPSFFLGSQGSEPVGFLGFATGFPNTPTHGPVKSRRRCAEYSKALFPWRSKALFGKSGKMGFWCRAKAVDPCRLPLNQIQAFFDRIGFRYPRRIRFLKRIWKSLRWFRIFDKFFLRFFGFVLGCLGLVTNIL